MPFFPLVAVIIFTRSSLSIFEMSGATSSSLISTVFFGGDGAPAVRLSAGA